ncbi:MAG TPA: glycine betaine ABC transporter substrate-binding protein [Aquabacterium sp.]|nr:glycine betaine ABC transporter substrate-binding protein [Aquabacterium sp.]HSW04638.1 glycine betaine ABC transporter substrate-binding protein [Aquabacterium sp.]
MCLLAACLLAAVGPARAEGPLRIGSKRFTESYILAQVLAQTAQLHAPVEVRQGLGNTAIVYEALRSGSIDVYAEYTGTIALEILKNSQPATLATLQAQLRPLGLGVDVPLGFNDGYALAMRADVAQRLGIQKLSDLARQPALRLGLSNEFIGRADGWKGLAQRYGLPQQPTGLDHGLAYDAIAGGQVDVIDIYTTDAKIDHLGLRVLQDDVAYFPRYDAVLLYRLDLPQRFPAAWAALQRLRGSIDEPRMIAMNARAELQGVAFDVIAREHLAGSGAQADAARGFWAKLWGPDLLRLTGQHLGLVFAAVLLAVVLGVPLATAVAAHARARALVLGLTGVLQTVPSLAMLAVLISLLGRIGTGPALVALTLYALLPIMRNTCTGLAEVPAGLKLAAQALGLTPRQRLRTVELPLALPVIVAGIRTAATISVGTATIAAFIGAGGYGERIVTGLALNDKALLLAGAVPAALLALLLEGLFELMERRLARRDGAGR